MAEGQPVIVTADLPRSVRYVYAQDEHVLVLAEWLDADGRAAAVREWSAGHRAGTAVPDGGDMTRHENVPLTSSNAST